MSKYNHHEIEENVYKFWEKNNFFKPKSKKSSKTFSIVIPPPNVTGRLHMGHALNNSLQDVLVRYYRMNGYETLWQPGTDHAGIATQAVVEKNLATKNIKKGEIGRSKFLDEVWKWKDESGNIILDQLKKLGCSCDWSRNRFTMDKDLSSAVTKVFVELYNNNLIFKDLKLINWDTKLQTAISDLEVVQKDVSSELYYIKYQIDGSSDSIIIATTRPETMMGDTAIAVNPKDSRYKNLVGKDVIIPIVNRKIKIIEDNYADPEQGSGAVKITPAHDFNDYEVGQRHKLKIINILEKDGTINNNGIRDFIGLDRFEARKKLIEQLKTNNCLEKVESIKNSVPYGDRSNSIIEPYLTEQWFVDAKKLAKIPMQTVKNKKTSFFPSNWTKTFFIWMREIQPWCISRQIWWGHRIPAWYSNDGKIFVAENEQQANKLAKQFYKNKSFSLTQDEDVLDTWFSSALWPFATLGWPKKTNELKKFYPTSILVTGFDIIFFWVARMMMMGNFFLKKVPFKQIYVHALVRDEKGQKMSKSKGNIIDPLELINEYGADALRFTLISMASPGRDVKLAKDRVIGYRNFITKINNVNNFLKVNKFSLDKNFKYQNCKSDLNMWILNKLELTIDEVNKYIKSFRFDEAARKLYNFIWHDYCDWYLELIKPVISSKNKDYKETNNCAPYIFSQILLIAHPFIPFVTEHLWKQNNFKSFYKSDLMVSNWPRLKRLKSKKMKLDGINQIIDLITTIRSTKVVLNVSPGEFCSLIISKKSKISKSIESNSAVLKQVGRIEKIYFDKTNNNSVEILVKNEKLHLIFDTKVDLASQKSKINEKINILLNKVKNLEKKLSNKEFIKKAPKNIVENDKKMLSDLKIEESKLSSIIRSIN